MNIEYRLADLMDHLGRFIAQGCNAQGKMGSGVAKVIRDLYPKNFQIYEALHLQTPLRMGQVVVVDCDRFTFFNGITQEFYGNDGQKYVDYDAVRAVMQGCNRLLAGEIVEGATDPYPELAMPLIGAGLAGGEWSIISQIIEEEATGFKPVVYIKDPEQFQKIVSPNA